MAAALLPVLFIRGTSPGALAALWLWPLAVFLAAALVLKRMRAFDGAPATRAPVRGERLLSGAAMVIYALTMYDLAIRRPRLPDWVWFCCVAMAVTVTVIVLRPLSRDDRRRIAGSVYGLGAALCLLFPMTIVPPGHRALALALRGVLLIAFSVLAIGAAMRQRKTAKV